ncbi:motility associated factor glycosyltransferase family protein [Aliarcobacter butzleri]|uniref:motility associated factor glycosyltransferase family protein n=1 Tax=Aliarcobacter butzleri TaxID=28197 RepID=UPI0021B46749|nr:6-hydroxymethylpterin diphosphokinase MptE-like protein [Aliarcobacter butzleri]MCT7590804.1 DUF115 domain-containing protein [Aliarcobacter butzleri]
MTPEQLQLQNALTTTFLTNLAFLNEYDNELYHRIENLSKMIEQGTYKERYELEFVTENGDFDIFDIATNSYLYGKKPKKINAELIKNIDFSYSKTILNIENYFRKYENSPTCNLSNEQIGEYNALLYKNMQEFSFALNDYIDNPTKKYKKIEKFVFFGVLTGRHIPTIAQKINSDSYMVFEKDLEIFRLSLFTLDYTILAKKGVIFSIMDDTTEVEKKISNFLDVNRFSNYSIKYIELKEYQEYLNLFLIINTSMKSSQYSYLRYLYVYLNRTTKCIENKYNFLQFNKVNENFSYLENIPVLYLAAGPSLDENIEWIYEHQNKFFIVTIGSVYKKLINKGIKIDLVTTIDEQKWLERAQFSETTIEKRDKNTIFLASTLTHEKILKRLKDKNLILYEGFGSFFEERDTVEGLSIGEITLYILLQLNIKNIYLIGLDLALNQDTGETHASGAGSGIRNKNNDTNILKIKGNLKDTVYTIPTFYNSIKYIKNILNNKPKNTEIFNLSSSGAFFEGTTRKDIKELNINMFKNIDKDRLNIKEEFIKFTRNGLDIEEKNKYKEKLTILEKDIKNYLQKVRDTEYKNFTEFKEISINFIYLIKDFDYTLFLIFFKYIEIVLPYLNYHFNDTRINQEYKKVQKIKIIFLNQMEVLVDDYILCIKRVL